MSLIFISYRRDDSAPYAGRLYDRLTQHFGKGQVFMDIEQIEPGEDFVEVIGRKVGACEAAVVLIGKSWLSAVDGEGRRRLDDPEDFVRLEVAAALKRNVRVLPVLVGGAKMPKVQQLPEPLALLARRNAFDISDSRFHADVDKLIETLERAGSAADNSGPAPAATPRFGATAKALSMGGLAAVAVGIAAVVLVPALRGSRTAAPTERVADTPAASSAAPSMLPTDSVFGGAMPADDERKRTETRRALAGSPEALQVYEARARQGSAEAQYRLAVIYECGDKNLPLAKRWYEAAAAQGHVAARNALAALQAPLPIDAREREIADIRRDMNCLGRLQENANDANLENDNRAKEAIKRIKPG